jgi:hypothetical protein
MIYDHPQHNDLIDPRGKLTSPWKTYFNNLKNEVNLGEAPADIQQVTASKSIKVGSQRTGITIRVVSASAGNVTVTANPQVESGFDGQLITIVGEDNTRTVTLNDGTGLKLSGTIVLKENTNLVLEYNAHKSVWIEKSRALT